MRETVSTRKTPASAASKKRPTKRARSSAGKSKSLIDLQRAHERDADDSARSRGLGDLRALPDELLVSMLGLLPPDQVARMCTLSKVFRCFCEFSELWKGFVLEGLEGRPWRYEGSWVRTFVTVARPTRPLPPPSVRSASSGPGFPAGFSSELLYRAWLCAHMEPDPSWLVAETVPRRRGLDAETFRAEYEEPNLPVILEDVADAWPARERWSRAYLSRALEGRTVLVGDAPMSFDDYLAYADAQEDELPLYLFDRNFADAPVPQDDEKRARQGEMTAHRQGEGSTREGEAGPAISGRAGRADRGNCSDCSDRADRADRDGTSRAVSTPTPPTPPTPRTLGDDYWAPAVLSEDAFSSLPASLRPDYRWLIAGPARSGSTFHVDPNATCAWNGVVHGSKRWILYPPGTTPPGVTPAAGGADVAAPVSVFEWYSCFYASKDEASRPPLECTVRAGETIFVPRGWWHQALNLEDDTIAVTQNYAPPAALPHVLAFLGSRDADLISGIRSREGREALLDRLVEALERDRPDVLRDADAVRAQWKAAAEERKALAALFHPAEKEATDPTKSGGAGGFSFGF